MSQDPISYLECVTLAEMLSLSSDASSQATTYLVVDVRDEDFVGGNVRGAVNLCSDEFEEDGVMQGLYDRGTLHPWAAHYGPVCIVCAISPLLKTSPPI